MRKPAFTLVELLVTMFIVSLLGGLVVGFISQSYRNNREVQTLSIVQTELNLAIDRLIRVLRSSTEILEATQTNVKMYGYPNVADSDPSEINFYIQGAAIKYSVTPPSGTAPNYSYNPSDAKIHTLIGKSTNSVNLPLFKYYDENSALLAFPVSISAVRVIEPNLSALDTSNILTNPIVVTTKINLRNLKTNL